MSENQIRKRVQQLLLDMYKGFHQQDPSYFKMYEKYAINTEKSILNHAVKITKNRMEQVSWENPNFRARYAQIYRKVKANLTTTPASKTLFSRLKNKEILPTDIASMRYEDMDPELTTFIQEEMDLIWKKDRWNPESIPKHQNNGLLKCGRCGSNNVSYFERQTRSADEPMTVFATCDKCGNKWRQ